MPDPISIISIAALSLHTARKTKELIDSITGAPRAVSNISTQLAAFQVPLANLNNLLVQNHLTNSVLKNDLFPQLNWPLTSCQETFENIENAIKPYVKRSNDGKLTKWRALKWGFKEKDIEGLKKELSERKEILDIAIGSANLIASQRSNDDVRRLNKKVAGIQMHFGIDAYSVVDSEFAGSDGPMFHSRSQVRNWLSETETVIEEPVLNHKSDNSATDDPQSSLITAGFNPDLEDSFVPEVKSMQQPALELTMPAFHRFPSPVKPIRPTAYPDLSDPYEKIFMKPLRKTIVSRAALENLQIEYKEDEHSTTVFVDKELEASAIVEARKLSVQLSGSQRELWWPRTDQAHRQVPPKAQQVASASETRQSSPPKSVSQQKLLCVRATQRLHPRTKNGNTNRMWRHGALILDHDELIMVDADVWYAASRTEWIHGRTKNNFGLFPKNIARLKE